MSDAQILMIVVAAIGGIAIFIFVLSKIWQRREKRIKEKVCSTSERYQNITALNSKYDFFELEESYMFFAKLKSKAQLERFNYNAFIEEKIRENEFEFESIIKNAGENDRLLSRYYEEIHDWVAPLRDTEFIKNLKISFSVKKYKKYEEKLVEEELLKPVTNPEFICMTEYVSPKGRNAYTGECVYTLDEIIRHTQNVEEQESRKKSKSYQRQMMTASLRYDIMKRDNFKCVLCGRSAKDGVKLHVDHIVPVSKGGLTTPDNLRTLCEECNFGKRDKYDAAGKN
jgi:hypothetical protein